MFEINSKIGIDPIAATTETEAEIMAHNPEVNMSKRVALVTRLNPKDAKKQEIAVNTIRDAELNFLLFCPAMTAQTKIPITDTNMDSTEKF